MNKFGVVAKHFFHALLGEKMEEKTCWQTGLCGTASGSGPNFLHLSSPNFFHPLIFFIPPQQSTGQASLTMIFFIPCEQQVALAILNHGSEQKYPHFSVWVNKLIQSSNIISSKILVFIEINIL